MEVPYEQACRHHHDVEAVASCAQCGDRLCGDCWTHTEAQRAWCLGCASEVTTRAWRRWSWAVTFLGLAAGVTVMAWRAGPLASSHATVVLGALGALGVTAFLAYRASRAEGSGFALRSPDDALDDGSAPTANPYRTRLGQASLRAVPRVSGKVTTLLLLVSLGLCAVVFPTFLHLPRWVEAELVLGSWWAAVGLTLAGLLYRGVQVADDFRLRLGWSVRGDGDSSSSGSSGSSGSWGLGDLGGADAEGCLFVIGLAIVLGLLAGASFMVAEVVLPLVFAMSYWVMNRAIARVANDRHDCAGDAGRSLRWGLTWSTVYVGPLAVLAWALHRHWPG